MKVNNAIIFIPEYDPLRQLQFESLGIKGFENFCIHLGSQGDIKNIDNRYTNIYIDTELPNMWFYEDSAQNAIRNEERYDYIFSICPYVTSFRNRVLNKNKYILIPHFFNQQFIPKEQNKDIDVIYTGNFFPMFGEFQKILSNFKSCIVSNSNISYTQKLQLIANSKITFTHNMLFTNPSIFTRKYIDEYLKGAFQNYSVFPQIKTRVFEAAFAKSLIVCVKDQYNVIENFFTPNQDFVYCELENARYVIEDVLANYHNYKYMIENAYQKAIQNYSTLEISAYLNKIV